MSSYTNIAYFENYSECFRKDQSENFANKFNKVQKIYQEWNHDGEIPASFARSGFFEKNKDFLYLWTGEFNHLDWYSFCDFVKKHDWNFIELSYFVVSYESDPEILYHIFTIKDIVDNSWENRSELQFLKQYFGK